MDRSTDYWFQYFQTGVFPALLILVMMAIVVWVTLYFDRWHHRKFGCHHERTRQLKASDYFHAVDSQ